MKMVAKSLGMRCKIAFIYYTHYFMSTYSSKSGWFICCPLSRVNSLVNRQQSNSVEFSTQQCLRSIETLMEISFNLNTFFFIEKMNLIPVPAFIHFKNTFYNTQLHAQLIQSRNTFFKFDLRKT